VQAQLIGHQLVGLTVSFCSLSPINYHSIAKQPNDKTQNLEKRPFCPLKNLEKRAYAPGMLAG